MTHTARYLSKSIYFALFLLSACSPPQRVVTVTSRPEPAPERVYETDTGNSEPKKPAYPIVEVGKFDDGKMWTFDAVPLAYLQETYDIAVDSAWFVKAQLGALRFSSSCTASFVSASGLVMTNHHCARESLSKVQLDGESLLDVGFYALDDSLERKVAGLYVEQLISIEDVTDEVLGAARDVRGAAPKAEARRKRSEAIERRVNEKLSRADSSHNAEVVELYSGVRYALYTYRKYSDVRLVFAPELLVGYFGGDTDNFTYPRHTLDLSFFRVWDHSGPLNTKDYYRWNMDGVLEGDPVFVVGNPGSTSRLSTVSQLEYLRDIELPAVLEILDDRASILEAFVESNRAVSDSFNVRNDLMRARNTQKSLEGQYQGLLYGNVLSRTYSSEVALDEAIQKNDSLSRIYGSLLKDIELLQRSKKASSAKAGAFYHFLDPAVSSHILTRSIYGYVYTLLSQRGAPAEQLEEMFDEGMKITTWPDELEKLIISRRLSDMATYLGPGDPTMKRLLRDVSARDLADSLVSHTVLGDTASYRQMLESNYLSSGDVTVGVIQAIAPLYFTLDQELRSFGDREDALLASLATARFAVFGDDTPPDATFTLRLSDGRVASYEISGTSIPAFTTLGGLYALADEKAGQEEWAIPERWIEKKESLDLSVPLNLVTTNDISGGSSGSALLNKDLEIVGLVFDGNLESLSNEFVYTDVMARSISLDARAIIEVLANVYDAERIVAEIRAGSLK